LVKSNGSFLVTESYVKSICWQVWQVCDAPLWTLL